MTEARSLQLHVCFLRTRGGEKLSLLTQRCL